jgi:hypothetical protein
MPYILASINDMKMVIASNTTGMVVELNPNANPLMMLGAAPE